MTPPKCIQLSMVCLAVTATAWSQQAGAQTGGEPVTIELQNDYVSYAIGADGKNRGFTDRATGTDCCRAAAGAAVARAKVAGKVINATSAALDGDRLTIDFGGSGVKAVVRVDTHPHYFALEVVEAVGEGLQELQFANIELTLNGAPEEPFVACALALNLQCNVPEMPRANSRLRAYCYAEHGFEGAAVALVACPREELRNVLKEVVTQAPGLPKSPIGGPWAMDADINRASYLFITPTEANVNAVIDTAMSVGFNQIEWHGGRGTYRFGDCLPNPKLYPNGIESIKAINRKLHAAGIYVGMHPYAFFMDKGCPWVTPVPDTRLAKDATFTLSEALTADATAVPVVETTEGMSTITGFFVRNSVTLHVDDELITYSGVSKEPSYAFTKCTRGAWGTKAAPHAVGAKVHHLKECFGLFAPDPDTTLLEEVAQANADFFNECDFDTLYLDALDGEDVIGGWHGGSKFVWELWKRLKKPAAMEYSTFHHHLWVLRSRHGAWDSPTRCHKKFIDMHVRSNSGNTSMFLPSNLGWWAFKSWSPPQVEPTYPDDIEYWCAKGLGTDSGLSLQGYNKGLPGHQRLAAIVKQYEELRHAGYFPESVKEQLRQAGKEFTLERTPAGDWQFRPVRHARHKVRGIDGWSNTWSTTNEFASQPAGLRIEALMAAGPYDAPGNITLAQFADPGEFPGRAAHDGVTVELEVVPVAGEPPQDYGRISATNTLAGRRGSWAKVGKTLDPPLNLNSHQALGVWVLGDGKGEVLNLQVQSPHHITGAVGEHYIVVDFTGWRYFELIETDSEQFTDYAWPYGGLYSIYRQTPRYNVIGAFSLWVNNLPANGRILLDLRSVKALPLVATRLTNPTIAAGGRSVSFPVEIESGSYLEFVAMSDCKLYGPGGELIREVTPQGEAPLLAAGDNPVEFSCDAPPGVSARANVTFITRGEPLE